MSVCNLQGCGLAGITETWWDGLRVRAQEQMAAQVTLQCVPALGHLSRTKHRDEAFYRQLQVASSLQAPVLTGETSPNLVSPGEHRWQPSDKKKKKKRQGAGLPAHKQGIAHWGREGWKQLGCSEEMIEFRILREGSKAKNKIATLDFRRADFGYFMDPLIRIPHNLPNYSKILGNCQKSKKICKQEVSRQSSGQAPPFS